MHCHTGQQDALGMYAGVQTSGVVYTVSGQEVEKWRREDLSKIAGEIMHITNLNKRKCAGKELGSRRSVTWKPGERLWKSAADTGKPYLRMSKRNSKVPGNSVSCEVTGLSPI